MNYAYYFQDNFLFFNVYFKKIYIFDKIINNALSIQYFLWLKTIYKYTCMNLYHHILFMTFKIFIFLS